MYLAYQNIVLRAWTILVLAVAGIFQFATVSRLPPWPVQPPIQWIAGGFPRDKVSGL